MLSLNCKTLKMLSLFLENIYSCFSNTNVQIYIYIYVLQNIYSCFSKVFHSYGNNAVNTEVIMKHSAPWWAQKSTQVHGPSAECGPSSAPSLLSHWPNLMFLAGFCTNGLSASREILGCPNATGISQMQLLKSEYWTFMLNELALTV